MILQLVVNNSFQIMFGYMVFQAFVNYINKLLLFSGKEYFVCDFKGHCVVVFNEEGNFLRRIGCDNVTNFPNGIDISDAGDILIGDSHGNRFHVAVFSRDGSLISEFECPYVKVNVPKLITCPINFLFSEQSNL